MKRRIPLFIAILAVVLGLNGFVFSSALQPANALDLQPQTFTFPEGSVLSALLQDEITTEFSLLDQPISAVVGQDVFIGTRKILGRSDRLYGRITRIDPPVRGRNAILSITFDTLVSEGGVKLPIVTYVDTGQDGGFWGGETTPGTVPEIIPYSIYRVGTYGRVMYHGPREMGTHVKLLPGTRIVVVLREPLTMVAF